ncbi:hypothetical protein CC1G_14289 [Coprinopsis cinerea okayama7|uniref:Uncharacterized protein n=1 Tax=Coprinopsis cinerea (strain Okayama-7 / 130 / ATCC MYA-4618 / FGSC 9003) TaxID=240176 RepID=D6RLH1_COPC7|nr:hypothetical protein CC1G_14289 [Coprinopsis cinerea okayama7\|eukprot:XP_002911759.1 hypothetical protein CC1G_14289 [Coprinopsis cinerea okayama7\
MTTTRNPVHSAHHFVFPLADGRRKKEMEEGRLRLEGCHEHWGVVPVHRSVGRYDGRLAVTVVCWKRSLCDDHQ